MENRIIELSQQLLTREWKLATAESCTGGGLAYALTNLSGSSAWFERGFVTYSDLSKEELLGVKHSTLLDHGAVSGETAREMAEGVLEQSQAQISVAITGIAGPSGGSAEKPVGTVWFGWASIQQDTIVKLEQLHGNRMEIREEAIRIAIEGLLSILSN